jgi:hypothetical protein
MYLSLLISYLSPFTTIQKSSPWQASIISFYFLPYQRESFISGWFYSRANHCRKILVMVFLMVVLACPVNVAWVVMAMQSLSLIFLSLRHNLLIKRFYKSVRVSGWMFKSSPVKITVPVDWDMHSVTLATNLSNCFPVISLLRILLRLMSDK